MNSLKSSSVDAGAGIAITGADREGEAGTGVSGAGRAGAGTLATDVALGLLNGGAVVFDSEETELLEREDLWEPLADPIGLATAGLLATL